MGLMEVIDLLSKGYECAKAWIPDFDRAYDRALRKWTPNSHLRACYADTYLADFKKFVSYIKDPSSIDPRFKDFLQLLYEEVVADSRLASNLAAEFSIASYGLAGDIKNDTDYLRERLDELMAALERTPYPRAVSSLPRLRVVYEDVDSYIPLYVRGEETKEECFLRAFREDGGNKSLGTLIVEGKNRLILFGHPQYGKSTVLAKLAYDLQESRLYRPFLFSLRNYSSASSLEAQLKLEQRFDNMGSDVLILDGLDELKEEQRDNVVSEIAMLSENYPSIVIVLSCRLSHKKVMTVSGFESLYLQPMSDKDLDEYIRTNCADPETFLRDASRSKLMPFLYVPFFLKESLAYFAAHRCIPADKVTIYEYFIDRALERDCNRKKNRASRITPKARLYPHLEHLAFSMLMSQRMDVSHDELAVDMGMSEDVIEGLTDLSLITKGEGGDVTFVHNSFKEYILAKMLSGMDADTIKRLVCYPGTEILVPALNNVVVLMISLIQRQQNWQNSEFKDWFVRRYPEILIEVGPECLDEQTREMVFEDIYNDRKRKGLHLDYWRAPSLIAFASTPRAVKLVLRELENSVFLDANCMNALRLAETADFTLLPPDEHPHIADVCMSLLELKDVKIGGYSYICLPLKNPTIQSRELLKIFFGKVKETENCYLIQSVCSMAMALDVSDLYADWVLSKAQYVCDYYENGVNHMVSDHDINEFMLSLHDHRNIIKALRILLPHKRYYSEPHFGKDRYDIVSALLGKLPLDEQVSRELLSVVDASYMDNLPRSVCVAFKDYFESSTDADSLFDGRSQELIEGNRSGSLNYDAFITKANLLSILLTDVRLNRLYALDVADDYSVTNILNRLREFEWGLKREYDSIDEYLLRKFPQKQEDSVAQKQFDILFDREAFWDEALKIFDGQNAVDFGRSERRLYRGKFNWSVIWFIREVAEDSDIVRIEDVEAFFADAEKFSIYVASRIPVSSSDSLRISPTRMSEINELVRQLIPSCGSYMHLAYCLIRLVVRYDLALSDDELIALLAWSGVDVREPKYDGGFSYKSRQFIDYVHDHIGDRSRIVTFVREALESGTLVADDFYDGVSKYVITYRVSELYASYRELLLRVSRDYILLNRMIELLKLGAGGYEIAMANLDLLPNDSKVCFYEHMLIYKNDNLLLTHEMISEALKYVDSNYDSFGADAQKTALKILFAYGMESAFERGKALMEKDDTWRYMDDFPTISGYSGQYFENLAEFLRIATRKGATEIPRPRPMYESVSAALKNLAMESTDMLEKVKVLFREVASTNREFAYYNRVADELDTDYYSRTVPAPELRQASSCFRDIRGW